jgi:hypothetical protein
VAGAVRGGCWTAIGRSDGLFYCYYTGRKHEVFRVAYSGLVHSANALRMDINNSDMNSP